MSWRKKADKPLSSEVAEDAAQTIVRERLTGNWLDRVFQDYEKQGGFDDLKGKGKPLPPDQGDVWTGLLKNANVLPSWLELRLEIIKEMKETIERMDLAEPDSAAIEARIGQLNEKIRKFNRQVPHQLLQKGLISSQTIRSQYEKWL